MKNLKEEYEDFLNGKNKNFENTRDIFLKDFYLISGITCIGKTTFLKKNILKILKSYKTGEDGVNGHSNQIIISNEKFLKKIKLGVFFDFYSINDKFYAYSLEDYFILRKEYKKVFADISIESIFLGLKYNPEKIFILDFSDEILQRNIKKRIKERNYDEKMQKRLLETIKREQKMLENIKNNLKNFNNIEIIKNEKDLLNRLK